MRTISEMQATVHQAAKEKGGWDSKDAQVVEALKAGFPDAPDAFFEKVLLQLNLANLIKDPKSPLEAYSLVVSEVSEAVEEARKDTPPYYVCHPETGEVLTKPAIPVTAVYWGQEKPKMLKPEGELIELADAVIRIMDYCGYKGWDLEAAIKLKHEYNLTRSHRHGGKKY